MRWDCLKMNLEEQQFDPSEVRGRILRGEPAATPSPVETVRPLLSGPPMKAAGAVPPFPDLRSQVQIGSGAVTPLAVPKWTRYEGG